MGTEIIHRFCKSKPEEHRPHAIDSHLVEVLTLQHHSTEFLSAIDIADVTADLDGLAVGEYRVSNPSQTVSQFVENQCIAGVAGFTGKVLIDQFRMVNIPRTVNKASQ